MDSTKPIICPSKDWFTSWQKHLAEVNAFVRNEEKYINFADIVESLEEPLQYALKANPNPQTSGLIEMQVIFARARE